MSKKIIVRYSDKSEDKRAYLQMIQESICRMSTISAIFKGFAATIVAGISLISYNTVNEWVLLLSFIPVISFFVLDLYYLKQERKFRLLYKQVARGDKPIDFSMALPNSSLEIIEAKATIIECLKSPSIYLFYPLLLTILLVVFILKYKGVLN